MGVQNIKMEPMNVTFGEDILQVQEIRTQADVASSLQNNYFYIYLPNLTKYYVWMNVGGAGVDPAPAGATEVEVTFAANASASAVASAVQSAIDALAGFTATVSGNVVTVTNVTAGYAPQAHDPGITLSDSGYVFNLITQGSTAADLGCLQGDIELTMDENLVDVTCHQSGTELRAQLRTGNTTEFTMTLQETEKSQLKRFFTQFGGSYVPAGANATELYGLGGSKLFGNTFVQAQRLVMHPIRLPSTDHSEDWCFWKVYLKPESATFSGENVFVLPVKASVYTDETKNPAVSKFAVGDWTQV